MNKTPNYQLNQWEAADKVQRVDFNADNAKIDAALAQKAEVVLGTYTGDGAASQFISLGFTPRALYVAGMDGQDSRTFGAQLMTGGLVFQNKPARTWTEKNRKTILEICTNGFRVFHNEAGDHNAYTNHDGEEYYYIALK